jgi:acyl-CoA reductase-like NAD-dependent aldehyde dehydrogenase
MSYKMPTTNKSSVFIDFTRFFNVIDGRISDTPEKSCAINPSTLNTNPEAPLSTQQDVSRTVEIARNAAPYWAAFSWDERADAIQRFANAIEANAEELATLIIMQQGKPVSLCIWAS